MSYSLDLQALARTGAQRAELLRASLIAAADYYFYGYWFSQRRA